MRKYLVVLAVLCAGACTKPYESQALALSYQPPRGAKLLEEVSGKVTVARFEKGIELRSAQAKLPAPSEETLEALFEQALGAVELAPLGRRQSARVGTLKAGAVARFEFKAPDGRTLVYVLPRSNRVLVASLSAAEAEYSRTENAFELSMASLAPKD